MLFCICGGFEIFGIVALFGWIMRKIRNIRKKHDAGECCELEHVDQEDVEGHTLLGRCSGCTTAVYVGDLPDEEESRLMKGYKFTCRDCKDCGIDG